MIRPQSWLVNSSKWGNSPLAGRLVDREGAVGQDLVGRDGDRADLLLLAGVLAHLVGA